MHPSKPWWSVWKWNHSHVNIPSLTLFPWTDFFSPRSSIFFMIVLIFQGQIDHVISPPLFLFHQQHSKPSYDVSSERWQMRAHRSCYHSSMIADPCPHANAGSLCMVATEIISLRSFTASRLSCVTLYSCLSSRWRDAFCFLFSMVSLPFKSYILCACALKKRTTFSTTL